MAPDPRDPAPSSEPQEGEARAELSGTELAGLWSRKRSGRAPRRERQEQDDVARTDPPA